MRALLHILGKLHLPARAAILLALLLGLLPAQLLGQTRPATSPANTRTIVIELSGTIDDFTYSTLQRRFDAARAQNAGVVILKINTYGGLVTSGLDISRFLKRQDDLHIIAFVDERAISAGAMITLACDELVMEPASLIGDCGVISMQGPIEGETERAKSESPVIADFLDSADRNRHDPTLIISMVQTVRVVHYIEHVQTDQRRFVDADGYKSMVTDAGADPQWRPVPGVSNPVDRADSLLTLSAEQAAQIGLSHGTFATPEDLAQARGLQIVASLAPGLGEQALGFLQSWTFRGGVISLLMLALFMGIKLPGSGVAEVGGVVLLALLVIVPMLAGYAEWFEVLLVVAGIIFLAVEIFILPGFGIAGVTGIILLLGGMVLVFMPPLFPPDMPAFSGVSGKDLRSSLLVVLGGMFTGVGLWLWLARYLPSLPYLNRLVLTTVVGSTTTPGAAPKVAWPPVGAVGVAHTDLRPGGVARFVNEDGIDVSIDVVCDRGFLPAGTTLVVTEVHGNRIVVRAG